MDKALKKIIKALYLIIAIHIIIADYDAKILVDFYDTLYKTPNFSVTVSGIIFPNIKGKLEYHFDNKFSEHKKQTVIFDPLSSNNLVYKFYDDNDDFICKDIHKKILTALAVNATEKTTTNNINNLIEYTNFRVRYIDEKIVDLKNLVFYIKTHMDDPKMYDMIKDKLGHSGNITKTNLKKKYIPDLIKSINKMEKKRNSYLIM